MAPKIVENLNHVEVLVRLRSNVEMRFLLCMLLGSNVRNVVTDYDYERFRNHLYEQLHIPSRALLRVGVDEYGVEGYQFASLGEFYTLLVQIERGVLKLPAPEPGLIPQLHLVWVDDPTEELSEQIGPLSEEDEESRRRRDETSSDGRSSSLGNRFSSITGTPVARGTPQRGGTAENAEVVSQPSDDEGLTEGSLTSLDDHPVLESVNHHVHDIPLSTWREVSMFWGCAVDAEWWNAPANKDGHKLSFMRTPLRHYQLAAAWGILTPKHRRCNVRRRAGTRQDCGRSLCPRGSQGATQYLSRSPFRVGQRFSGTAIPST